MRIFSIETTPVRSVPAGRAFEIQILNHDGSVCQSQTLCFGVEKGLTELDETKMTKFVSTVSAEYIRMWLKEGG